MGYRGEQRRAQPLGFGGALDAIHILDQAHALDGERALVHQRVEEAPLVGGEQRARLVAVDADDADGAAPGMHRQEQALGAGQRVGAAAGGAVVLPGPFRRGEVGVVERVFRRIARLHRDGAVARQQQHDAHFQHQRGLIGGRPQHVVERAGAGELAAEGVKRFDGAHAGLRRHRLHAAARGDVGDDDGDEGEQSEGRDIVRIGDGERVDRRQKEKVVGQRRHDAGEQRRPEPEAHGNADDGGEEDQIDVLDADPNVDQFAAAERDRHRHQRQHIGARVVRFDPLRSVDGLFRQRAAGKLVAGDDMDADIAGTAHQVVHHRAMQDFEPARPRRFADDDLRDVMGVRIADHVVGDVAVAGRQGHGFAAQRLGKPQRVGDAVALLLGKLHGAPPFDVERHPGPMQAIGQALGVAHQAGGTRILADAYGNALARRPWALDGVRLHLGEQLLVDPLGGAAQAQARAMR